MNPADEAATLFADFGITALMSGVPIRGIFDNSTASGLSSMMLGSNPTFTCTAAAAGSDARSKTLAVAGVNYTIREVKPDGTGFVLMELEQA